MIIEKEERGNILEREKKLIEKELQNCTDDVRVMVLSARLKIIKKKLVEKLENTSRDLI